MALPSFNAICFSMNEFFFSLSLSSHSGVDITKQVRNTRISANSINGVRWARSFGCNPKAKSKQKIILSVFQRFLCFVSFHFVFCGYKNRNIAAKKMDMRFFYVFYAFAFKTHSFYLAFHFMAALCPSLNSFILSLLL